jgi:hypothetical protein
MSKVKIAKCVCTHKFQDKKYGKNKRVFNYSVKGDKWRCTVCKREK